MQQLFDLSGRVALVTGGSRGLGLQMAEALGETGARVALTARHRDELDAAVAHLAGQGIEAGAIAADLAQPDAPAAVLDAVAARYGTLDILVNNAGTSWGAPAEEHPWEAWRKVMALNVDALFLLTQEAGRRFMIPRRSGKVLNIASISGLFGNPPQMDFGTLAYSTSKGAVVNFTRSLAAEWGKYGINVNALCPGFFPSKMSRGLLAAIEAQVIEATPLGRLGGDEDLKGAALLLVSDAGRHITGQCLVVDGGMSAV